MGGNVSVEFLVTSGFSQYQYPDGLFWVRWFSTEHFIQVNEQLDHFTEFLDGWVEELTEREFIDIIYTNSKQINQK